MKIRGRIEFSRGGIASFAGLSSSEARFKGAEAAIGSAFLALPSKRSCRMLEAAMEFAFP